VKQAAYRLRAPLSRILRSEIGKTVSSPQEVDEELRFPVRLLWFLVVISLRQDPQNEAHALPRAYFAYVVLETDMT